MQHVPSEMERRYRSYITGRGDAGVSLFRCLGEKGGCSSAWAAHVLSRIYLVRGRMGLARSFLDLSIRFFERGSADGVPLGLEINRALILWSEGESDDAERLLRAVLRRALDGEQTFVASKAASNLSMMLARTGRPAEAASFNGLASTCYRAMGYTEGIVRTDLNGALIEGAAGRPAEAVDRIARILSRGADEHTERERAAGALLLAEMFLITDDIERAGEALRLACSFRRALRIFRPVRLRMLCLAGSYRLRRGERARAERLARTAERMRVTLGLHGLDYRAPERKKQLYGLSGRPCLSRESAACAALGRRGDRFLTSDRRTLRLLEEIRRAAPLPVPVLVRGETGVGKELVSRLIHEWSGRSNAPFLTVNAAALTRELFESTLFGHVRGAFTGAVAGRSGLLAAAGRGTVFLDEIAELDTALQAKLLRFLDDGEYLPVGSDGARQSGARVIAATNRNLEELVETGSFSRDLFYRLSVLTFTLPPLRARPGDISPLLDLFLRKAERRSGIGPLDVSEEARALLAAYDWPGNVRELEGEILRAAVKAESGLIRVAHLSARLLGCLPDGRVSPAVGLDGRIAEFERGEIEEALRAAEGNRSRAARILGIKRTTLLYRMKRHGIDNGSGPSRID